MSIETGRGFGATLNCLCMKTVIVGSVRVSVELGAAEIRQALAGRVTTLGLKIR